MNSRFLFTLTTSLLAGPGALTAQAGGGAQPSNAAYTRAAELGAPAWISSAAAVARIGTDGRVASVRTGTNGFTCTVMTDGSDAPFCGDKNAWDWLVAAMTRQPKPGNAAPGIAYMMRGGMHFEMPNGDIMMEGTPQTRAVKEPPHWMVMWPVDPAASGLPTRPNAMGVYVMFAGTPYAHLMIYQNPATLQPPGAMKGGTR